ncbi:hypothetical protein [Chryseobacterium sp. CT-SW4]|uniref:hypothetical protein n=1 Tax=Chryseobacterium sp. SW-1 TaxID=3157343 RepID=UPI003B014234
MKTFLIYVCLFILCFSCSKREKKQNLSGTTEKETERIITDTTLIGGALIELIDNNGKSEIKIHSEKYSLSGKIIGHPPFYFLRNNGEVLSLYWDFAHRTYRNK